ncbi:MAG: ribosome small subunit-dependent GTPase A [Lachnospiraceae bacterium]|nr:ribosome small subunit-dependent GTPase A [Lachnospiraceae bacterium]
MAERRTELIEISSLAFEGIITKAVGGVYYVDALDGYAEESVKCAARGIFRARGISPAAGDRVLVETGENADPVITEIHERKNFLVRPPLANLDKIVLVNSTAEPAVNRFILDKLIAIADSKGIEPVVVFTKIDLETAGDLPEIYRGIGVDVCTVDNLTGEGADEVRALIEGKISAFVGNSGVGKSSLLNALYPELALETAHISKKLGRGRHTTRQVELFKRGGGYIADTPGFSTVDTERYCRIPKGELDGAFREFGEFLGECAFADCAHVKEKGCAVRAAVEAGKIAKSRYESYLGMYEEASQINDWER